MLRDLIFVLRRLQVVLLVVKIMGGRLACFDRSADFRYHDP